MVSALAVPRRGGYKASMNAEFLKELLGRVATGATPVEEAMESLKDLPYRDIGAARVDLHRALRQGIPEVIDRKSVV